MSTRIEDMTVPELVSAVHAAVQTAEQEAAWMWQPVLQCLHRAREGMEGDDVSDQQARDLAGEAMPTIMFPTDQPQTVAAVEWEAEAACMITSTGQGDLHDSYD